MPPLPLKMVQNTSRWCRIPSIPASIGWFLTVLCLRIGQKVFLRWFAKFKKVLKKEVIFSRIIPIFLARGWVGGWVGGVGGGVGGGGGVGWAGWGGGGGGASFRQGLLTGACGFQRRFVRIRLVSHNSDEVPESKFGRRKCSVVGTFEVI